MLKTKYVSRVLCILFIVNLFVSDLKPLAASYSIGNIDIISNVDVSVESVEAWAKGKNATETFVSLAALYKKYGQARGGVNWVLAYVQAAKETGYGRFGGVLDESFHNLCGLKVPSGGDDYDQNAHKRFDNWEQGVIAHLDHLALYAGAKGYPKTVYVESWNEKGLSTNETYDPRHIGWFGTTSGILGKATNAIDLGSKWAPSSSYGVDLFRMYCDAIKADYLEGKSNLESPSNGMVITDGKLNIKGWALHAFGIKEIKVYIEGEQVGTLNVGITRSDVSQVYPGYYNGNNSGFEGSIDISRFGVGKKNVNVVIISTNNEVQSIKSNIIIGDKLQSIGNLEEPNNNETIVNNTLKIKGWALASSGIKEVRAYIDEKDLGIIKYGISRVDVDKVYPGYINGSNSGFEGTINVSGIAKGNRKLIVKAKANDGTIQTFERIIRIENLESRSCLDEPTNNTISRGTLKISGWALASSGVKEVRVYIDGKDLGTIPYGTKRADVNNVYPGYSSGDNAGFNGTVNISSVSNGNKKLTVKITSNDGTVQTIDRTIRIENLESRSCLDEPTNNAISRGTLKISGWALASSGVKEVRVYVDGKDLGTIPYGTKRADVNNVYPGYSSGDNAGFNGTVNISSVSNGNKKLTVKITSNDGTVQTIDRTIRIENLESRSCLDEPTNNAISRGTLKISGWALASSGVKEVRVYVDGKDLGTIPYGTKRADVNKAYPGYSSGDNAGFNGTVNISSVSNGNKKLTVKITSNDGAVQTIDRTIRIENLESRSCLDEPTNNAISRGTLKISGWALASSGVKEVRVYVDGKDLGTIPYGTKRADVNNVYPGYSSGDNAGFNGTVNISSVSNGNKKLTVKITSNDGAVQTIDRTIRIENLESRSCLDEPTNNAISRGTLKISGWALASSGVKEVRVYIDGKDLGTIPYGTKRADVNNVYPGYSSGDNAGFNGTVNISSVSNGNKKLTVKITSNDGTVQTIDRTIRIENLESRSCLDEPTNNAISRGTLKISGWALASSGVKEVRVYVDGKDLGTIPYGTKRADVNNVYPGYSSGDNAGFNGTVNISSVSNGNKKLTVKITSNDGTVQTIDRTIRIENLESRSCLDEPTNNAISRGTLKISGWALASSGVKEVRVYVDGKDLGTIPYGTKRVDVNNVYPGYSSGDNAGFNGTVNISSVSNGNKKLTVKITANDGSVQNIERNFSYKKKSLVVVDPGHELESIDPGAVSVHDGIRYVEANLNLQIAIKLKGELEARGIEVYMTRYDGSIIDRDSKESLKKRVRVANSMNADLFVSIHHNSFSSSSANGFEVYYSTGTPVTTYIDSRMITEDGRDLTKERTSYYSRSNTNKVNVSRELATAITNEASATLGLYNRGAKDSNLYVCKNTLMPAILIENGFLSNKSDAKKANSDIYQQKLAEITARRISEVLR